MTLKRWAARQNNAAALLEMRPVSSYLSERLLAHSRPIPVLEGISSSINVSFEGLQRQWRPLPIRAEEHK